MNCSGASNACGIISPGVSQSQGLTRLNARFSTHAAVYNVFNIQPHLISRPGLRQLRAGAQLAWAEAAVAA
ncbi:MAG: hypothetical protein JWL84_3649 [Rhodospirillales bacterium]|nr:hypothetical protein [Rhodospirillales bacterium]